MYDLISRQEAIELIHSLYPSAPIMRMNRERWEKKYKPYIEAEKALEMLPSAHQQYEPVTAEDFAKTMSENSLYNFVVWHQEALTLMKEHGFVICKKTM